ncbi:MAG: Swt1 family HEPN domain-containing protein [Candidatus Thorarchaeota archaeon]|jgi:hypothetical protein
MNKLVSLRKKLAEEYGCSERTITNMTKKRWNEGGTTFSKRVAALSLLADIGIDPAPFANARELEELRKLQGYLKTIPPQTTSKVKSSKPIKKATKVYELKLKENLGNVPINLSPAEMKNAETMSSAYYYFYVFENSIRKFIMEVMADNLGEDWWDKAKIRKTAHTNAASRKKKETDNRWLDGSRGKHPIFYIDFDDYKAIMMSYWRFFKPYFEGLDSPESWVLATIEELTLSRHNVAHMGYLGKDIRQKVQLNLKAWLRQIKK